MSFRNAVKLVIPMFLLVTVFAAEQTAKTTTVIGDPFSHWHDLLANRGHNSIEQPE